MKAAVRDEIRRRLAALSPADIARASAAIARAVLAEPALAAGAQVGAYLARPREPQTAALLAALHARGCRLAVPAWRADARAYAYCVWLPGAETSPGPWDIPQPARPDWIDAAALDAELVPLLAFDRGGRRLGHGGGHFDRLLAGAGGPRIGLALACQEWPGLPEEPHDVRLHRVITEEELIVCPTS
jgi:5-formyltetrahydrofolate cyclo-ligase